MIAQSQRTSDQGSIVSFVARAAAVTIVLFVFFVGVVNGQMRERSAIHEGDASPLTGSLSTDLFASRLDVRGSLSAAMAQEADIQRKSPWRAALYSAVVPGTGDIYVESYWTGAAFLTAEVALWITYILYTNSGDTQTSDFERFADQHWSVVKYAQWMEQYATILNPSATGCSGLVVNPDVNLPPWERVDWDLLNRCEEAIGQNASTGFSHRLPRRPDQQYYELIGKYRQYNPGWDDANVTSTDYLENISPRFIEYRDMRGQANSYYTVARTASYLIVANHVLAALHSAWRASEFNKNLDVQAQLKPHIYPDGFVDLVLTTSVTVRL